MTWSRALGLSAITVYQWSLAAVLGGQCRFAPSCSEYARQCVMEHGLGRGGWHAIRRLARCHPFHPGGYDPPPPARRRPD